MYSGHHKEIRKRFPTDTAPQFLLKLTPFISNLLLPYGYGLMQAFETFLMLSYFKLHLKSFDYLYKFQCMLELSPRCVCGGTEHEDYMEKNSV